jgi:glucosylceramidase
MIGHFSKFVVPGAYRIGSDSLGSVSDVAFKNPDGSKVVVVYNDGFSRTFAVRWNGSQSFTYTLPAGAMVTFKWM